jgi:hypothetical protein
VAAEAAAAAGEAAAAVVEAEGATAAAAGTRKNERMNSFLPSILSLFFVAQRVPSPFLSFAPIYFSLEASFFAYLACGKRREIIVFVLFCFMCDGRFFFYFF